VSTDLALALASAIFSAGLFVQSTRTRLKDVNGLGRVVRDVDKREDRHYLCILAILLRSHDTEMRDEALRALRDG